MIEYLEQLVEEKRYQEVLQEAERLAPLVQLRNEVLAIQVASVIAHCRLGKEQAALASGDSALSLAGELGDWDSFGTVSLYLGVAYSRLGQYEQAMTHIYEYLGRLSDYRAAYQYEAIAWFNLGTWLVLLGKAGDAAHALSQALGAALRLGNHRYAHGVRQALVDAQLRAGLYDNVPRLLAQSAHYLRRHPNLHMGTESWIFHLKLRGEYALATGRTARARALATRGLQAAAEDPSYGFWFHMLLTRIALSSKSTSEAAGHALAARTSAIRCNRPDLEAEASDLILIVSSASPGVFESVDEYFCTLH